MTNDENATQQLASKAVTAALATVRTKIFMDTEFTGLHQATTLISISLVSECGKTFYAEFTDYAKEQLDEWLLTNVIANTRWLKDPEYTATDWMTHHLTNATEVFGNTTLIKYELELWLLQFPACEMIADTLAYDWVLFNNIWGHAFTIPKNIFYIPTDISVLFALIKKDAECII